MALDKTTQKHAMDLLHRYGYVLFMIGGAIIISWGISYYLSPLTLLKLNGVHLRYGAPRVAAQYLVGTHSETKSWAYREGTMDSPLPSSALDETGAVIVERDAISRQNQTIHIRPQEWIKMSHAGDSVINQSLPLGHLSLSPASIVLDPQGGIIERQNNETLRLGKVVNFIFPNFPKGTQHPGSTWTDRMTWTDTIGEWKIGWEADLGWHLKEYDGCYNTACAKLEYQAELHPHVVQAPPWALKETDEISFEGQGRGDSLYNTRDKLLISNTLTYSGRLSIPIAHLDSIPLEQRVGYTPSADPGVVVIDFANKIDIRKPS